MDGTALRRRRILPMALLGTLGLILLSAGPVLAAGGVDLHGMLEACQRAMGALASPSRSTRCGR
jgi:hypothetical protein